MPHKLIFQNGIGDCRKHCRDWGKAVQKNSGYANTIIETCYKFQQHIQKLQLQECNYFSLIANCPQAASISLPLDLRTFVITPFLRKNSAKASTLSTLALR